jgi:hypothetical protein
MFKIHNRDENKNEFINFIIKLILEKRVYTKNIFQKT